MKETLVIDKNSYPKKFIKFLNEIDAPYTQKRDQANSLINLYALRGYTLKQVEHLDKSAAYMPYDGRPNKATDIFNTIEVLNDAFGGNQNVIFTFERESNNPNIKEIEKIFSSMESRSYDYFDTMVKVNNANYDAKKEMKREKRKANKGPIDPVIVILLFLFTGILLYIPLIIYVVKNSNKKSNEATPVATQKVVETEEKLPYDIFSIKQLFYKEISDDIEKLKVLNDTKEIETKEIEDK